MIKKILTLSVTLACFAHATLLQAEGNVSNGKVESATCAGCHGEDGNSMVPTYPKLAGQHADYLVKQLQAFKSGSRNAPMMAPYAMALDDNAMADITAYYAEQKISSNDLPTLDLDEEDEADETISVKELMTIGSALYRNGNDKSNVPACSACHGPSGEGNKPSDFPSLRSQHADYIIQTLTDYKNGSRTKKTDNMMYMIAKKMSDQEIKAVAYHLSMKK